MPFSNDHKLHVRYQSTPHIERGGVRELLVTARMTGFLPEASTGSLSNRSNQLQLKEGR